MAGMDRIQGFDSDEDFYEDDEPVEQVIAAFEAGDKFVTGRPPVNLETHGLAAGIPVTGSPHVPVRMASTEVTQVVKPLLVGSSV